MTQMIGCTSASNPVDSASKQSNIKTGIPGLDDVLNGGLTANRVYLIEGSPGSGKTTLGLSFLLEGVRNGESVLYVTLSETAVELEAIARSHGWTLRDMHLCELIPSEESLESDAQITMFHAAEVELSETTKRVLDEIERSKPTRVVFDSLSEMALLAQNPLRYRRQILALKQFFTGRQCTVLMLDDKSTDTPDVQLQSLAHGVIELEQLIPIYGAERRRLNVRKMRGKSFRGGYHDFTIRRGKFDVFPRIVAAEHRFNGSRGSLNTGSNELDALLGGGLDHGASTLIVGPTGCGKSSLATLVAHTAAQRGEKTSLFLFDETIATFICRSASLGMNIQPHIDSGAVSVTQIDPAEMSPGQFAQLVRSAVEEQNSKIIVIDSLNGYLHAMPEEKFLTIQLHELLTYLNQLGVATLLIATQHGIVGADMHAPVDASYLSDCVILLRYFEATGAVHQAISVVKKRSGKHERTIREFKLTDQGIVIGRPLQQFQAVLSGVPEYLGEAALIGEGNGHL